jgi:glycopeptide antibiotics resistance protein
MALVTILTALIFGLTWLGIVAFLWIKRKSSVPFLIFFTIFYVYLFKVLDYTLFQFQSLLLLKQFMPNLMLNGQSAGHQVNLIPLVALTSPDLQTSLLNILLFVPFGFGLPFITKLRAAKVILTGAIVSMSIELLQLLTGYLAGTTFRIADINDLIFNTTGTAIGYALFLAFLNIFRRVVGETRNGILRYMAERPQI